MILDNSKHFRCFFFFLKYVSKLIIIKHNIDYKKGMTYTLKTEENTEVDYILYNFMIVLIAGLIAGAFFV